MKMQHMIMDNSQKIVGCLDMFSLLLKPPEQVKFRWMSRAIYCSVYRSFVYIFLVPAFRSEVCSTMTFHCCHPVLNTEPTLVLSDSLKPICTSAVLNTKI